MNEQNTTPAAVADIMSHRVVFAHIDHDVTEAARRMRDSDIGFLAVLDGDEVVGAVTDRDIVSRGVAKGVTGLDAAVQTVMTRHVVHCRADAAIESAIELMTTQRVRRLAVVDADNELVGVLSLCDIVQAGQAVDADRLFRLLRALAAPMPTAKTPGPEDSTGGRARGSPRGEIHVYAEKPVIRRRAQPHV